MKTFKNYLAEVKKTKRVGIDHINKMKPLDFIALMQYFKNDMEGILKGESVKITEKVDGMGLRFGVDDSGRFFLESSNSGPQFVHGAFSDYTTKKHGKSNEISQSYDDIFAKLEKHPVTKYLKSLGGAVKVVCECLYVPMGKGDDKYVSFIATKYDRSKLGKTATFVLFNALDFDNLPRTDYNEIINNLKKLSDGDFNFDDPSISSSDIDVTYEIKDFFTAINKYKEIERVITSRKKVDKEEKEILKSLIQKFQNQIAGKFLAAVRGGKFGPEIEGIVIELANGKTLKVVTDNFKKGKESYNKEYKK